MNWKEKLQAPKTLKKIYQEFGAVPFIKKKESEKVQELGILWLRVWFGLGIASHGYPKIFRGRMDRFSEGVSALGFPLPELFAWAAALSEFLGGILIALGLATRPAAFFAAFTMFVAAFIRHAADPFSRKELALVYFVVFVTLILTGAGKYSLDALLCRKLKEKEIFPSGGEKGGRNEK